MIFTNLNTRKGQDLRANPRAALTFYWPAIFRQVNITGHVELTGDDESDTLWDARGLPGQVASTVSRQGTKLEEYQVLAARAAELTAAGPPIARPLNVRQLRETTPSAGMAFAPGLDEPLAAEH